MKPGWIVTVFFSLFFSFSLFSEILRFPHDEKRFAPADCDSVFLFTDDFGVTAWGPGVTSLGIKRGTVTGENLPPTLKIRNVRGAICYRKGETVRTLPVIRGRRDLTLPLPRALRQEVLGMTCFRGRSSKGGLTIHVWDRRNESEPKRLFFENGGVVDLNELNLPSALEKWQAPNVAGLWVRPPRTGNHDILNKILEGMARGPLLVEYWDGLGWTHFEDAAFQGTVTLADEKAVMAHAVFPPRTKANYRAMIYGQGAVNLFQALSRAGVDYQLLEGESLLYPAPGNVHLHGGVDPVKKDRQVFEDALAIAWSENPPPLLFVHYHGLDDLLHEKGPSSEAHQNHLAFLWKCHEELAAAWRGSALLISDHGGHDTRDGGIHGDFVFSDMAVPMVERSGPQGLGVDSARLKRVRKALSGRERAAPSGDDQLMVMTDSDTLFPRIDDFGTSFTLSYQRRGAPFVVCGRGTLLSSLLRHSSWTPESSVEARSRDGRRVLFSGSDSLWVGFDKDSGDYTLYPARDRFPNRLVKQLIQIRVTH